MHFKIAAGEHLTLYISQQIRIIKINNSEALNYFCVTFSGRLGKITSNVRENVVSGPD